MTYPYDIEAIRARLSATNIPAEVCMAYLQLLTNINALNALSGPSLAFEDEQGGQEIERLLQNHLKRKRQFDFEYPLLATMGRPKGWKGE